MICWDMGYYGIIGIEPLGIIVSSHATSGLVGGTKVPNFNRDGFPIFPYYVLLGIDNSLYYYPDEIRFFAAIVFPYSYFHI